MTLATDLLEQAGSLARRERRRPKQASLRRAVSAAYYSLFHLLIDEASRLFVRNNDDLRAILNRVYKHGDMVDIAKSFAKGDYPKKLKPITGALPIPLEVRRVAQAFVDLQQARHEADYNLAKLHTRTDALTLVAQARAAFTDWGTARNSDLARVFLGCFLAWGRWN